MKVADWRAYVHDELNAASGVTVQSFPSGAVRIRGKGVDVMTGDMASLSRSELEKLTGKGVGEFLELST